MERKKKAASERPVELCVKNSSFQPTNTVSSQRKKKAKKDARLAQGMAKKLLLVEIDFVNQSRQLTYDCKIEKRAWNMSWVMCKSLFNSMFNFRLCQRQYGYYLHMLIKETKQCKWKKLQINSIISSIFSQVLKCLFFKNIATNIVLWTWYQVFDTIISL